MSEAKEKLREFVKEESKGMNLVINGIIFGWNFLDNVGHDGVVSAFFGAAITTIIVAAICHFIVHPYIMPALKDLFKR